ncbi:alpha/beta hydrolase [Komagataeibacter sp. AV436]|uniref:Alpha/beta hydrolase n=1 Tax=Komagataeibacter melomenusus TaxID=2766578 RepID=A0ABX2AHP1_9PROT|nr:alpha/beta hydrolase [Komagataeibacter melomenusus]MBV1829580.1 alpha/beta hydrolase [Komagataeibacter melomenusus]NPC67816.1 alpha/beta hydrolase [Komagataeibacter melomenusus]
MFDSGKFVSVGDTDLFVSEAGNLAGRVIVLLHGGLQSRRDFIPLAKYLAKDYRLIAIDTRGHGRSGIGTAPLTYRQLEDDFTVVLTAMRLQKFGIIGHSDGGIAGLRLAASRAVQPECVIAVGAHWVLPENDPARRIYQTITLEKWHEIFGDQISVYNAENPQPDFGKLFTAAMHMWLGCDADAYPGASVKNIQCPLLVVHGDDDMLVSRQQGLELTEQVKSARLLNLPFARHTLLEDMPERVFPFLRDFMNRVTT